MSVDQVSDKVGNISIESSQSATASPGTSTKETPDKSGTNRRNNRKKPDQAHYVPKKSGNSGGGGGNGSGASPARANYDSSESKETANASSSKENNTDQEKNRENRGDQNQGRNKRNNKGKSGGGGSGNKRKDQQQSQPQTPSGMCDFLQSCFIANYVPFFNSLNRLCR